MSKKFQKPALEIFACDLSGLQDVQQMSDAELILKMEELGYPFQRTFQKAPHYIHRKVADTEVLIAVGEKIADFNGYIELNPSAVLLWEAMSTPRTFRELRALLEEQYQLDHRQATADLQEFLQLLQAHDMVTVN